MPELGPAGLGRRLDRLTLEARITGYTLEPPPGYLAGSRPALTYSVYRGDRDGRRNLARLVRDLQALGADLRTHARCGMVLVEGRLRRNQEITLVAEFGSERAMEVALDLVQERHAADGARPLLGSWRLPDVRICGTAATDVPTVKVWAHVIEAGTRCAVVLTLGEEPPLSGMASHSIRALPCWALYLATANAA